MKTEKEKKFIRIGVAHEHIITGEVLMLNPKTGEIRREDANLIIESKK